MEKKHEHEHGQKHAHEQDFEVLEPKQVFSDATLRNTAAKIMLGLFAFSVVATFAIIILYGLGYLNLPGWLLKTLVAATIGEVATLLGYTIRYLFPQATKNKRK
jgi:hypothetical protein